MSEWNLVRLGDICLNITDGSHTSPPSVESGYYMASVKDMDEYHFNLKNCRMISETDYLKLVKNGCQPQDGDVLIGKDGARYLEDVFVFKQDIKLVLLSSIAILRPNKNKIISEFLFYFLKDKNTRINIKNNYGSGSAIPRMVLKDFKRVPISIPNISDQKVIADTLSCLDEKIELNNRMNKTLEEMAQAIFKSWFVDFEPFKDGEFEDSEMGMIPKGWRVGKISDLGEVVGGSTPSKAKSEYYTEKGIAWITPKDLSNNKDKFISKGNIDISELGLKNSSTKIMPKGTVLFSSRAPIGYVAVAKNDVTTNQGFKSVVPKINIGTSYIYCFLKNNIEIIENRATGSTFKEVSGSIMKGIPVIIPDDSILIKFQNLCDLYFEKQMVLESENRVLINIRDTLLPKLMSGEIRVPIEEAE
ncbi:restriction endonuclease subunit S [Clostridium intestinale]|uniref:Restriction modification system DNA specificity domain-containing protein n=1 Tax=Clostridium intestinale URNW TaxID=1294142 RepID=U2N2N9_9CLOT|nr:restriction endonuclease subunit S [Clostridium intestinale]ERK29777.1 restriction modification system DNA specificity domain-containing protein [Clostridium intestinale URNW]